MARDLDAELPPIARLGQPRMIKVRLQLKIRVLDPIGMIEVERQTVELALEHRRHIDPAGEMRDDVFEADLPARRGCGIIQVDPHYMG